MGMENDPSRGPTDIRAGGLGLAAGGDGVAGRAPRNSAPGSTVLPPASGPAACVRRRGRSARRRAAQCGTCCVRAEKSPALPRRVFSGVVAYDQGIAGNWVPKPSGSIEFKNVHLATLIAFMVCYIAPAAQPFN